MNYLKNFFIMNNMNKKLITHNGSFHSDDIFAAAAFSLLFEKNGEPFEIIRTRDKEIIKSGYCVFDVGGVYDEEKNLFDHHQKGGAGKRENGIDYSSFGLVWKKYGEEICDSKEAADLIDKKLVAPIDAGDNGIDLVENKYDISPYLIQHAFSSMYPTWRENDLNKDEIFLKCVAIAKIFLQREVKIANDIVLSKIILIDIYKKTEDKRIIILDDNYPFESVLCDFEEPLFVIYPRKTDNTWGVKAITKDISTFENRKDLPKEWGGLMDEELVKISLVPDAIFCHRALFLAVAKSREGAIKLAQIAVES